MIRDVVINALKEVASEKVKIHENSKNIFMNEVNKKINPSELLSKANNNGIAGNFKEINDIKSEVKKDSNDDVTNDESDKSNNKIKTINESLEGKKHSKTGVVYELDKLVDGKEGVFPKFDAKVEVQLSEELYLETDSKQFKFCTTDLKQQLQENPKLREKFTKKQIEQIENGRTPTGYTWHHHQQTGKMQLVSTNIHDKSAHTGGRAIWGGSSTNR